MIKNHHFYANTVPLSNNRPNVNRNRYSIIDDRRRIWCPSLSFRRRTTYSTLWLLTNTSRFRFSARRLIVRPECVSSSDKILFRNFTVSSSVSRHGHLWSAFRLTLMRETWHVAHEQRRVTREPLTVKREMRHLRGQSNIWKRRHHGDGNPRVRSEWLVTLMIHWYCTSVLSFTQCYLLLTDSWLNDRLRGPTITLMGETRIIIGYTDQINGA